MEEQLELNFYNMTEVKIDGKDYVIVEKKMFEDIPKPEKKKKSLYFTGRVKRNIKEFKDKGKVHIDALEFKLRYKSKLNFRKVELDRVMKSLLKENRLKSYDGTYFSV